MKLIIKTGVLVPHRRSTGMSSAIITVILILAGIGAGMIAFTIVVSLGGGSNPNGNGEGLAVASAISSGNLTNSYVTIHLTDSGYLGFTITHVYINSQGWSYDNSSTSVPPTTGTWGMVVGGNPAKVVGAGQTAVIYANSSGVINPQIPYPLEIDLQDNSSIYVNTVPS